MKKFFISVTVLFCAVAAVFGAPAAPKKSGGGYRPAGTVAFANLEVIARAVSGIAGKGSTDLVLTKVIPNSIRNQPVVKLFGPMRPGANGAAVCYVDPVIAARVAASKEPTAADLDRAKRWCMVYPTTMGRAAFMQKNPTAVNEPNGSIRLPPGKISKRNLWVWFSKDDQWAVLAPSASMAAHAFGASSAARARKLGGDLAYVRMDVQGARAVFGSDLFADGELSVRMAPAGLELRASARKIAMKRPPLPPGSLNFSAIAQNAPLFGVTTTPSDVKAAEGIFAMAGPEFGSFVRKAIILKNIPGASAYYLNEPAAPALGAPRARLLKILPEAQSMPATANALFCSPTTVMRLSIPKVAAKMLPMDSAPLYVAQRLLRKVRGDGLGCMSWSEGNTDKILIRISRDELFGTANLWSMALF